jgi:amino acid transporter
VSTQGSNSVVVTTVARKLGLGAIIGIIFFSVSGGPYGLEDVVGYSGPGMAILLIIVTPIIYSLPIALMVAELATMMPVSGGYYQWVKEGLGPFWGFQAGWWAWVASWFDLAIYPVLFVEFSSYFLPALQTTVLFSVGPFDVTLKWVVGLVFIWVFAGMNMLGSSIVGDSSKLFLVIVLTPFVLIVLIGLTKMQFNPAVPFTADGISPAEAFGAGLFVIMWNYGVGDHHPDDHLDLSHSHRGRAGGGRYERRRMDGWGLHRGRRRSRRILAGAAALGRSHRLGDRTVFGVAAQLFTHPVRPGQ